MANDVQYTNNVLADLGVEDAEELSAKVHLAVRINKILDSRGLKQVEAGEVLGLTQGKVSAIRNYKLDGISVGKLMDLLTLLGRDVTITVSARRSRAKGPGRVLVEAA